MSRFKKGDADLRKMAFIILSIFLALRLIASFFPKARLWGLNQAAYFDGLFVIYIALLALIILIYFGASNVRWLKSPNAGRRFTSPLRTPYPWLILVAAGLGFYFLSAKSHFLGDGYTAISILGRPVTLMKTREFGEAIIHLWFFDIFGDQSRIFARFTYRFISMASGFLFVLALLFYTWKIAKSRFGYYSFVILNLLAAGTILFYGYVENYSLVTLVLYVTILSSIDALRNQKKSIVPIVAFAFAVFLHSVSLAYLPGIIAYIALTFTGQRFRSFVLERAGVIMSALCGSFVIFYAAMKLWAPLYWRLALMSPFGDRFTTDGYFLLAPRHLIDFANLILFLAPAAVVVLLILLRLRKSLEYGFRQPESLFLLAFAISGVLAAFTLEPKLGMGRDWDLMSTMIIGTVVAGIFFWHEKFHHLRGFRPATLMLLVLSLSIIVPWLTLINSIRGQYYYDLALMELDPSHGRSGFYTMIAFHERQGNRAEVIRLQNYCRTNFPEVYLAGDAEALIEKNNCEKALPMLERAIEYNPGWFVPYRDLAECDIKSGRIKQALKHLKIADALNPYNPEISRLIDSLRTQINGS